MELNKAVFCMRKGFTLIELIVVIAIIAILAAIIAPQVFKTIEKAKITRAVADLKALKTAAYSLYTDTRRYPVDTSWSNTRIRDNDVLRNIHSWPGWDGPYIEKDPDPHPWKGIYRYVGMYNLGKGTNNDLSARVDYSCYSNTSQAVCGVPVESQTRIDEIIDDRNLSTGDLRGLASGSHLYWILFWDAL